MRTIGELLGAAQTYEGYGDVAYNFMVDQNDVIYEGRSLEYVGAHVRGKNDQNVGIAVLGEYEDNSLNEAQVESIGSLIDAVQNQYGGNMEMYSHGYFDERKTGEMADAREQLNEYSIHWPSV